MAKPRSPQEKKALSYAKDRRNDFGENDKASRRSIRRNKRTPNRAQRHREHQVLAGATGPLVGPTAEGTEERLLAKKPKRWRKWRDAPLGEVVARKLSRRVRLGMQARDAALARHRRAKS